MIGRCCLNWNDNAYSVGEQRFVTIDISKFRYA